MYVAHFTPTEHLPWTVKMTALVASHMLSSSDKLEVAPSTRWGKEKLLEEQVCESITQSAETLAMFLKLIWE